jgi:hypothetical protein
VALVRHRPARFLLSCDGVDGQLHFEKLVSLAVEWATEQEGRILREGVPLSEEEIADAKAVGVKDPERVRLLQVDTVPTPAHPLLKAAYDTINLRTPAPRGLALRYGISIRSDYWRDRSLIAHELAHTAQYERLGGIVPFLRQYFSECMTSGYRTAPMEQEASAVSARVCSA